MPKNSKKIISIHKEEPYRSFILDGKKLVEGRLNRGKWAKLKSGDILKMRPDGFEFIVKRITKYKTFQEMLKNCGLKKVLPDCNSIEKGIKVYRKYYSKEDETKFGVLAVEIMRN